ncbi:hypothetical protein E2C01_072931 [Portunus trituberculatus]|uniref:Uncharacterized protein n=1 Tax=Portunus trituberculatus TaxID=210409 RepID=A0A5B7I975_PORTR|nr:hypothetical protein [Portunus trituberculatus]
MERHGQEGGARSLRRHNEQVKAVTSSSKRGSVAEICMRIAEANPQRRYTAAPMTSLPCKYPPTPCPSLYKPPLECFYGGVGQSAGLQTVMKPLKLASTSGGG